MPGPNCKPLITCVVCGHKQHRGKVAHKYSWRVRCHNDDWEHFQFFSNRNHAMEIFRAHKHDSDEALSLPMQEALKNLREAQLI